MSAAEEKTVAVTVIADNHTHEDAPAPKGTVLNVAPAVAEWLIANKVAEAGGKSPKKEG